MKKLYDNTSFKCSKIVTQQYSTSFSMGIKLFDKSIRNSIFSIYGFVRFADEIVDTFHNYNKEELLNKFEEDYYSAYKMGISLNPILNSFQLTVRKYNIDDELIQAFIKSMRSDLLKNKFNENEIREYIYGSADVVGLMCLKIFVNGDNEKYNELKESAMRLGSAFQKVNFLRDIKNDVNDLHRVYFPQLEYTNLSDNIKDIIVEDIEHDFKEALKGIKQLPKSSRKGVHAAYQYFRKLNRKLGRSSAQKVLNKRVRIPNLMKVWVLGRCYFNGNIKAA